MSPKTIPSAPSDIAATPAWCAGVRSRALPLTAPASGPNGLRLAGEERGADRAAEGAERLDGAVDEPDRHRVLADERARPDAAREPLAALLLHDREEIGLLALAHELARAGLHRAAAGVGLHAAVAPARALRAADLDDHVADLAGGVAAEPQLAVEHDA